MLTRSSRGVEPRGALLIALTAETVWSPDFHGAREGRKSATVTHHQAIAAQAPGA
jgi:hypothetical protein